jgi:hypothetical protein
MNGVSTHRAWNSGGSTRRRSHLPPDVVELFQARLADEQDLRALGRGHPAPSRGATRIERSRRAACRTGRVAGRSSRRRMGVGGSGLLLGLGESPADRRAVAYVARLLGRRRGFRVYVVYVLPEFPSSLREHGGAGDPEAEERLSAALRRPGTLGSWSGRRRLGRGSTGQARPFAGRDYLRGLCEPDSAAQSAKSAQRTRSSGLRARTAAGPSLFRGTHVLGSRPFRRGSAHALGPPHQPGGHMGDRLRPGLRDSRMLRGRPDRAMGFAAGGTSKEEQWRLIHQCRVPNEMSDP